MQPTTPQPKKPLQAMLALMRQNLSCYIGAMIATAMIVLIGFLTPILLAETIEKNGLSRQTVVLVLPGEGEDAPAPRTCGPHTDHD